MDPLNKLTQTFSLVELRAEKATLDAEIAVRARRANQIERLISLLTDVGNEQGESSDEPSDEDAPTVSGEVDPQAQRPSLDDAILRVMSEWDPMTLWRGDKLLVELERKGWAPGGRTPRNTVDATLSRLKKQERLERVDRGVYKLPSETSDGNSAARANAAETLELEGA